ncbi:MAG TPA: Mrp/NBP35 family ATP-binding protein [Acidimicrobiales bacterium]|nr:Mrp/NBP35 family ATP-binding protein [Acidimicrobiales bacterium]
MAGSALLPTVEDVREVLRGVIDPELGDNLVDLGMITSIEVDEGGAVGIGVALTVAGCPLRAQIKGDVERRVASLDGVAGVRITWGEMTSEQRTGVMERARKKAQEGAPATEIPATAKVVAIASGKGGVGKSSITANLAVALALQGFTVGVLDADIAGFSIPRMLGVDARLQVGADKKILPVEKKLGPGLLKVISMGSMEGTGEDQAIMWRGLMLNRALQHFLEDVAWGSLDYLLLDMPPGTGDVQMGLARMLPRTEMIIVTTPALGAQKVAARAADMAKRGYLRVAGVIENMSAFTCDHGESYALFGAGGGQRLADDLGVELLGQVPLHPEVSAGGDDGSPVALGDGGAAEAIRMIAARIVAETVPPVELASCSARLLERVEAALGPKPQPDVL